MIGAVLDASVLLALLLNERGSAAARHAVQTGRMSAVNYAEVVSKLIDRPYTPDEVVLLLEPIPITVVPFDADLAFRCGVLRERTRHLGLSLGDRACLALALREQLRVFTADKRWAELKLGVEINVIR